MMKNFLKAICVFTLILILFACSSHITPSTKLAELHHKDFTKALRWKQFKVAASHIDEEYREAFLATFKEVKDIDIVDVRLTDIQFFDDNSRFEINIEMDYVLLPSIALKTFNFDQTWEFKQGANQSHGGYIITTPFPEFP